MHCNVQCKSIIDPFQKINSASDTSESKKKPKTKNNKKKKKSSFDINVPFNAESHECLGILENKDEQSSVLNHVYKRNEQGRLDKGISPEPEHAWKVERETQDPMSVSLKLVKVKDEAKLKLEGRKIKVDKDPPCTDGKTIEDQKNKMTQERGDVENKVQTSISTTTKLATLKKQLMEKGKEFDAHMNNVTEMISRQASSMTGYITEMEENQNQINLNEKGMGKLDLEIKELQETVKKLQIRKIGLQDDSQRCQEKVEKIQRKKEGFEKFMLKEKERAQEKELSITKEIKIIEEQIKTLSCSDLAPDTPDPPPETSSKSAGAASGVKQLEEFLKKSIKEKELGLECPVCLETADIPIFCCTLQHPICSICRPNVKDCPTCREPYEVCMHLCSISLQFIVMNIGTSFETQIC